MLSGSKQVDFLLHYGHLRLADLQEVEVMITHWRWQYKSTFVIGVIDFSFSIFALGILAWLASLLLALAFGFRLLTTVLFFVYL